MAYQYPSMVAFNPGTNNVVRNTAFQVYAPGDTAYASPLPITDNAGKTLSSLTSSLLGVFPAFQQAQYTTVVVSDYPNHVYSWTVPAALTGAVLQWASSTYYGAGQAVINPSGDLVRCITAHTSGASYDSSKFTLNVAGADPLNYGASSTADSASAFLSAASAGNGVINLRAGQTYQINTAVNLPAGTVINGNGATILQYAQSCLILSAGCTVRDLTINAGNTVGYVGQETGLSIQAANCLVSNVTFTGNAYRYGILIQIPGGAGGSCDNITIRDCKFNGTSYGILKQGGPTATPTTANNLQIRDCRFKGIRRGDAIELNAGADYGVTITGNIIDDVTADSTANAGMGIAVAGLQAYGGAESGEFRRFLIANNIVTNVSYQAIHTEIANRFEITGNYCEQITNPNTGYGIVTYGARNSLVSDNEVIGFNYGIYDDIGASGNTFIISTDRTMIASNAVRDCGGTGGTGIYVGVSGQGKSTFVERNNVFNCPTGIYQFGAANYYYTGNTVVNCTTPYGGDCNPSTKSAVAATARTLAMYDNKAFQIGGTVGANSYVNTAGTTISGANNTFTLPT